MIMSELEARGPMRMLPSGIRPVVPALARRTSIWSSAPSVVADLGVDGVGALSGHLQHPAPGLIDEMQIAAGSARHHVGPEAAVDPVVALAGSATKRRSHMLSGTCDGRFRRPTSHCSKETVRWISWLRNPIIDGRSMLGRVTTSYSSDTTPSMRSQWTMSPLLVSMT